MFVHWNSSSFSKYDKHSELFPPLFIPKKEKYERYICRRTKFSSSHKLWCGFIFRK